MIARARSVIVRLAGVSLLTGAGLIVSASPASAGNPPILVNTGADPPPGACQQPPAGDCSLREAYALAAATANPDTIVVDDGVNAINLNGFINFTDTEAITLLGNTTTITQTASNAGILWQESSGPLTVDAATLTGVTGNTPIPAIFSSTGDVTLTNAALVNNSTTFAPAAGIYAGNGSVTLTNSVVDNNDATRNDTFVVGGVVAGSAVVTNSTITNNSATGTAGGLMVGGIRAESGNIMITGSTISGNTGTATIMDGNAIGGINAPGNVAVTVSGSTVSSNSASSPNMPNGDAVGGIQAGDVTAINSTVSNNTADGTVTEAGGIYAFDLTLTYATVAQNSGAGGANVRQADNAAALTSFGSVVAYPVNGQNCLVDGTVTTSYSYEAGANSCGFIGTGDINTGADPLLGALANNGGATQTRLPGFGSPLVNKIPGANCQDDGATGITTDQRGAGFPRPDATSPSCDIGAVEGQAPPPPPPVCPASVIPGINGASLAGAEGMVAVAPVGFYALFRRRRRGSWSRLPRRERVRSIVTWLMVAGLAVAIFAACQPVKKTPPLC